MELEARVRRLEDEAAIRDLLARYCFAADMGWSDAWAEVWTDDAVLDVDESVMDPARYEGREALLELVRSFHRDVHHLTQHWMVGPPMRIFVDGDEASAEGYEVTFSRSDPSVRRPWAGVTVEVIMMSLNRWQCRRVSGEWRISACYRRFVGSSEQDQVFVRSAPGS